MTRRRSISTRERVRLRINPLSDDEQGRGVHLPDSRVAEIRREAMRLVSDGFKQYEIAAAMGASKSRLSRWVKREAMETNAPLRLVKHFLDSRTLTQLMWDRIIVKGQDECWPWAGQIKENGYGTFNYKGKVRHAHRLVYETLVGDIPCGRVIDHICCNPSCVNPRHLQTVTQTENLMLAARRRRHA